MSQSDSPLHLHSYNAIYRDQGFWVLFFWKIGWIQSGFIVSNKIHAFFGCWLQAWQKSCVLRVCWPLTVVTPTARLYLKVAIFSIIDCHSHLGASFLSIFSSRSIASFPGFPFVLYAWEQGYTRIQASFGLKLYFPEIPKLICRD